ncbi:hypothetical protein KAX75_04605 [candidate division WOR-3 bacterium]|nr:hypothetical protein [candidate division WOR-3 bacterium]
MKSLLKKSYIIIALIFLVVSCAKRYQLKDGKFSDINTIKDLDKVAVFNFVIMSDNKGDSPKNSRQFENMVDWIEESNAEFVIGLGDHVKRGWDNSFLPFVKENEWWYQNFYPNVADGENEYYGENQGDWGAGAPILDEVNLSDNSNVFIRDNSCEYYAKILVEDYTVHLIQLHFSDQPKEDTIAFKQDSRNYLVECLESIEKGTKDIVIAAAHSRTGFWIDVLSQEQQNIVMDKCDLVLSATTHFWERKEIPGYEESGPLIVNTGSITYPSRYCPYGYVEVHVFHNPFSIVVQYINADYSEREMQHSEYAFVKIIGAKVLGTNFRKLRPEEDMDRVVGFLSHDFSQEEMDSVVKYLYLDLTEANEVYIAANSGLEKGEVTYRELWDVFPYNNEIYSLTLTPEGIHTIFGDKLKVESKKELKLAINSYNGNYIIEKLKLTEEQIVKTGKLEISILEEWVKAEK